MIILPTSEKSTWKLNQAGIILWALLHFVFYQVELNQCYYAYKHCFFSLYTVQHKLCWYFQFWEVLNKQLVFLECSMSFNSDKKKVLNSTCVQTRKLLINQFRNIYWTSLLYAEHLYNYHWILDNLNPILVISYEGKQNSYIIFIFIWLWNKYLIYDYNLIYDSLLLIMSLNVIFIW